MSPLNFLLIVCSLVFLFFAIDGMQRRRFSFLHFLIFAGGIGVILLSVFYPGFQDWFSRFFGVARVADIVVYGSLIVLAYFYFELLNELTKQKYNTTRLVSADAMRGAKYERESTATGGKASFVFLVRAYNEGACIAKTLEEIIAAGFSKVVIVDDGSSDNTVGEVEKIQKKYPQHMIVLLSHLINRGGGAANKTGFAWINRTIEQLGVERIVTYDADGQMDINDMDQEFIKRIEKHQKEGDDIQAYLGSRFIDGAEVENMPQMRRVILRGSKLITRFFNRLSVSDPHNGYRVLHKNFVKTLKLHSDGMTYASELLDNIRIQEIPYEEVPVHIIYTDYSLGKGQKNSNAFKILLELIYKKVFFK